MNKIFLKDGKSFSVESGETILDAALSANIVLEHSCKTGRCGACIAKVKSGNAAMSGSLSGITKEQLSDNYILTCCAEISADVELEVDDIVGQSPIKKVTLPGRISKLSQLSDRLLQLEIRFPPGQFFEFKEGQYINLSCKEGIRRSYSISNAPREDNRIELLIGKVDGGLMSDYLFNRASKDDLVRIDGPHGTFGYRESGAENIIFLATGTGIAPIYSILQSKIFSELLKNKKSIHLYWGVRTPADIFLGIKEKFGNLNFVPVYSQAENLNIPKSYVQQTVLRDGLELSSSIVYACGSSEMIGCAKDLLVKNGLPEDKFKSDAFVSSEIL